MTWTIPGLLVYAAHVVYVPMALVRPRLVFLLVVATAVFRSEKIGPPIISTNQLEGLALAVVALRLWSSARPLRLQRLDLFICLVFVAIAFVRLLHAGFYDVGFYRLGQFVYQDSFRPLVFFLAAHLYLRSGGTPRRVVYAACFTVAIMIVAVLLEWRFFWSWRAFFGTVAMAEKGAVGDALVSRFGYRLLSGPFGHWVGTGTFLTLYLPFALVTLARESRRAALVRATIGVAGLASSLLIGGRAAILGSVLASAAAVALLLVHPGRRLNWVPSWAPVVALCLAFLSSATARGYAKQGYEYLYLSLNPGASEAGNLNFRSDNASMLWSRIGDVPLIGYGWMAVRDPDRLNMPVRWNDFEVNFIVLYSYDLGVAMTMIWLLSLLLAAARAAWVWLVWRDPDRWTAAAVIIISAALVPIFASNGAFIPQFSQPWLLTVALMTHAVTASRRSTQHAPIGAEPVSR